MATLKLPSQDYLLKRLRYDPETGKLYWLPRTPEMFGEGNTGREANCSSWNIKYAGAEAFTQTQIGYCTGGIDNKQYRAHRIIWKMMTGEEPGIIDHINGDPLDNRWGNLRSGTHADNHKNTRRHGLNSSGMSGVSWAPHAKRWRAYLNENGRRTYLGYFDDFDEACRVRNAANKRHGFSGRHGK